MATIRKLKKGVPKCHRALKKSLENMLTFKNKNTYLSVAILDDNRKIYFKSLQNSNYTGIGLTISGWWF